MVGFLRLLASINFRKARYKLRREASKNLPAIPLRIVSEPQKQAIFDIHLAVLMELIIFVYGDMNHSL